MTQSNDLTILIAEDDDGHATLIRKNLTRSGLRNRFLRFRDGEEVLAFLNRRAGDSACDPGKAYLLLLDIRMPKLDGVEVLRRIKSSPELRGIPVIMISTTDDPSEVRRCHDIGCSSYLTKPIDYDQFVQAIRLLGLFLMVVSVPEVDPTEATEWEND